MLFHTSIAASMILSVTIRAGPRRNPALSRTVTYTAATQHTHWIGTRRICSHKRRVTRVSLCRSATSSSLMILSLVSLQQMSLQLRSHRSPRHQQRLAMTRSNQTLQMSVSLECSVSLRVNYLNRCINEIASLDIAILRGTQGFLVYALQVPSVTRSECVSRLSPALVDLAVHWTSMDSLPSVSLWVWFAGMESAYACCTRRVAPRTADWWIGLCHDRRASQKQNTYPSHEVDTAYRAELSNS